MHSCSICHLELPEAPPQRWTTQDGDSVFVDQTATPCAVVETSVGEITVCDRCYAAPPPWLTPSDLRELHYQFALEYRDLGDHQRSIHCLQTALSFGQSPPILSALGSAYEATGAPGLAEEQYRRALALDPEHANSRANLGRLTRRCS